MFSETLKQYGPLALASFLTCGICLHTAAATNPLTVTLASSTVPPGGTAQLQFFISSPIAVSSGSAIITLDPAIFDNITAADVYSATGDQIGVATIQGRQVDIEFTSQSGGIGRLPNLPVLSINVPVLATAPPGTISTPVIQPGIAQWLDIQGQQYTPTFSGAATVGGALSVRNIQPPGTLLPAGTVVQIAGTGFTRDTTVQFDGVPFTGVQFANPQELTLTLAAPTDLTGRRLTLQNLFGPPATFFCTLHGAFTQRPASGPLANIQPILPTQLYSGAYAGNFVFSTQGVALQNPSAHSVNVSFEAVSIVNNAQTATQTSITLSSGESYFRSGAELGGAARLNTSLAILPDSPIRMALVSPYSGPSSFTFPTGTPSPTTQLAVVLNGSVDSSASPLIWNWTPGGAIPQPIVLGVTNLVPAPFSVSTSTHSGGSWLSVSPSQGNATCVRVFGATTCSDPSIATVSVNPVKLTPGTYNGTVTFLPQGLNPQPTNLPVILNVLAKPTLFADGSSVQINVSLGNSPFNNQPIHVTSSADPVAFTISSSTLSGQNWLSVTPSQGQTPADLSISISPSAFNAPLNDTGTVTIDGPNNSLAVQVSANILPAGGGSLPASVPNMLEFVAQTGQPAPVAQTFAVPASFGTFTVSPQTASGGNWLSVSVSNDGAAQGIVGVDPTRLQAGTYQGSVSVIASGTAESLKVPVTLHVYDTLPPLTITPTSVSLSAVQGGAANNVALQVSTGDIVLPISLSISTTDGANWLNASIRQPGYGESGGTDGLVPATFPGTISISANVTSLAPGAYSGTVTATAPSGTLAIPVSLVVLANLPPPAPTGTIPLVTAVLNAASFAPGGLSPGEIITLFGQNFGPAIPAVVTVSNGKVSTMNSNVQVLFDGVPAPLLYVSPTQINTVVPYEVNGALTNVSVLYNGTSIPAGGYSLVSAAPAIFAVVNQDGTVNSAANPAPRGSTIQIYATGEGVTQPAGVTGGVTGGTIKTPVDPVTLTLGGVSTAVTYAASAPGQINGLFQVNAVVPQSLTSNSTLPIVLTIGSAQSPAGATVAVK
jgi:uncharacterized protein (TIGR03437 family)